MNSMVVAAYTAPVNQDPRTALQYFARAKYSLSDLPPKDSWEHRRKLALLVPVGFYVYNSGRVTAHGVRATMRIGNGAGLRVFDNDSLPQAPLVMMAPVGRFEVWVEPFTDYWDVTVKFGKVQPSADRWTSEPLYIGATVSQALKVTARVFADNLSKPIDVPLSFDISAAPGTLTEDPAEE